jgi:hypothetical protein
MDLIGPRCEGQRQRHGAMVTQSELATMHRGAGDYRPDERRVLLRTIVYPS